MLDFLLLGVAFVAGAFVAVSSSKVYEFVKNFKNKVDDKIKN